MGKNATIVAERTNRELADKELEVLQDTALDPERYRPDVGDEESYDALVEAVRAGTARNERLGELRARVEELGSEAVALAKKVAAIVRNG